MASRETEPVRTALGRYPIDMRIAIDNLKRAHQHGVSLVTGSDAGNFLVIHGPTVQHELELWVQAGIPAGSGVAGRYVQCCPSIAGREANRLHSTRKRR